jgi:hypothetical protein
MSSLESKIRGLMVAVAMEQDNITFALDKIKDHDATMKLADRRERLARLAETLIYCIDKEIEYFAK